MRRHVLVCKQFTIYILNVPPNYETNSLISLFYASQNTAT